MKEIQSLNPQPDRAINAMIMFLTINTAGLTIIPVSILALYFGSVGVKNTRYAAGIGLMAE